MLKVNFVASLAERDIDLVLLEELSTSDEFCDWFAARVEGTAAFKSRIGAWHSVCHPQLGESDLIFVFNSGDGREMAVLIENKIDAAPQPEQGKRYQLRGQEGKRAEGRIGDWDAFKTCIVAPARYLDSSKNTEIYDAEVSYEEIRAYFSNRRFRDERYQYKATLLLEAIEQNRRGYQATISKEMTTFAADYVALASKDFPQLHVEPAKPRPVGSTWIMFHPLHISKQITLCHQLTTGYAKVLFNGMADQLESLRAQYGEQLTDDIVISKTGKSVALSIAVPVLDPTSRTVAEQRDEVRQGLAAVNRLYDLLRSGKGTHSDH